MQKAPGMKPGAFTVFRVTRWLKGTFRKTPDQFLVYKHTITKAALVLYATAMRESRLNSPRRKNASSVNGSLIGAAQARKAGWGFL